jgi:hypothetical protein
LAIPDNTFSILSKTKQTLSIPNITRQPWYQLVSPGINKASSIAANMISVLQRYHLYRDLTVFWLSGLMMVPIQVILRKPSKELATYKCSSSLDPFVSYKENEVV